MGHKPRGKILPFFPRAEREALIEALAVEVTSTRDTDGLSIFAAVRTPPVIPTADRGRHLETDDGE